MKGMLFQSSQIVAALNHVEGFNPADYARVIQKEGQADQLYLDVAIRKLWFRLKYPLGKIRKTVLSLNENMAAIEARIYLDKNDPDDQYIACGFSQKFRSLDEVFGDKFMETAETTAVGRALTDAGFGIQFADVSGERDQEQVDAGIELSGNELLTTQEPQSIMPSAEMPAYNPPIGQPPIQQQPPYQNPLTFTQGYTGQETMPNVMPGQPAGQQMQRNLPAETFYAQLNYEQAVKVVILGNGKWTGKTLGQVAVESPSTIDFFANGSYKGPDNLIRAAARIILEKAQVA